MQSLEPPSHISIPRSYEDSRPYTPKSARLYNSPYLYKPFTPLPPDNGGFPMNGTNRASVRGSERSCRTQRSARSPRRIRTSVPYTESQYVPPEIGVSYVERMNQTDKRNKDFDVRMVKKYTRKQPMPVYRNSLKSTYKRVVVGKQTERRVKEEYEYQSTKEWMRKRADMRFREADRAHNELMMRNDVHQYFNF